MVFTSISVFITKKIRLTWRYDSPYEKKTQIFCIFPPLSYFVSMQYSIFPLWSLPEEIPPLLAQFWKNHSGYRPIWQTLSWNHFLQAAWQQKEGFFIGVIDHSSLLSFAIVEKRSIGAGMSGLFVIGGPNSHDQKSLPVLADGLQTLTKESGSVFIQCEMIESGILSWFQSGYYKSFLEQYTLCIDLLWSEESILSSMKQKWRYNIRLAQKHGVKVEKVEPSEVHIDIFMSLLYETLERDNFSGNSRAYYQALLQSRSKIWEGLYFARIDDRVVAAAILVIEGDTAVYYYGASTSDNELRKYMGAYLLQWTMIQESKRLGARIYDFLGVADPNIPSSHLAGVTDFKLKFSSNIIKWPEKQIFIARKFAYSLLNMVRWIKHLYERFTFF